MDLRKFIVPTVLDNTDLEKSAGDKSFRTKDLIYLDSFNEVRNISMSDRITCPTDYAVMNGVKMRSSNDGPKDRKSCWTWLRSGCSSLDYLGDVNKRSPKIRVYDADVISFNGGCETERVCYRHIALCPTLHLSLSSVISARRASCDFFRISEIKTKGSGKYHTIEFGEYPKTYVGNEKNKKLEGLYFSGKLCLTGKTYTGRIDSDGKTILHSEFEYEDQKYVRVLTERYDDDYKYSDGTMDPENRTYRWARVEPIVWEIRNWDEMPTRINPLGNGSAKFIDIITEEAIVCLPFHPDIDKSDGIVCFTPTDYCYSLWQNSPIRGYLNGINVNNIKTNGNKECHASGGGNFSKHNFLNEALDFSIDLTKSDEQIEEGPYGFIFEELDNDKLIKLYVQSNAAIFLHGPSGVGKSGRVKQLDPTATRITLRPQMNPEEVDGTLDRETGKFIPPLWYTQLCEKCKAEPERKHVLFIDELTNVKPTVQSLIYSIVLDRAGKDGLWPLPENAVVVAAGNENADNLAAYPLTNALFRRFSHIYYEVDKNSWLDWAMGVSKVQKQEHVIEDKTERARIHPAIVAYIMSRDKKVLNQDLDEENPHIVTDPRKWEIASNVLYTTKNPNALKPAIGEELTADFVNFVQSIQLSVEDVIMGRYDAEIYKKMNISSKLSTIAGLCMASEKDLPIIRRFIASTMGKEILATYDSLWIRNDPERAEIIAECDLKLLEGGRGNELEF